MAAENKPPWFSIITICRNEQKKIRATCESICDQKYRDFEWIVIDGASTDGTLDILNEYRDAITLLVSESDAGIYNAMNKGIVRASGQYLVFMNGGDRFADSDVLNKVANAPQKELIFGDLLLEDPQTVVKSYPAILPAGYLLQNMLPHQACFLRRDLFEKYGVYDESFTIAGDYDLFARLLEIHRASYFHIPQPLAFFDGNGISKDSRQRTVRKKENHRIRKKYFPQYRYSMKALRQEFRNLFCG